MSRAAVDFAECGSYNRPALRVPGPAAPRLTHHRPHHELDVRGAYEPDRLNHEVARGMPGASRAGQTTGPDGVSRFLQAGV